MRPKTFLAFAMLAIALPASAADARGERRDAGEGAADKATVRTVTLDFQSGIKTTIYSDGALYEESFDPARMRRIASRPGANDVVGSR